MELNGNFFEGVEKLLEIWFSQSEGSSGSGDARNVSRYTWETILDIVQCKILDEIHDESQTAYLLSESSMFVSKRRVILKTCGTTLCLQALPHIIKVLEDECGLDTVADCFYSRKNFMKPDHQPHPHKTFQDEIIYLNQVLSDKQHVNENQVNGFSNNKHPGSASYCLGRIDGDCWFLYTLNHVGNTNLIGVDEPDQTLEILMTDLDRTVMDKFVLCDENGDKHDDDKITEMTGIKDIIPDSKISAKLFDPCGYSMNGLLPEGQYWTIHVTPEEEFSYVSFETNWKTGSYAGIIEKVVKLFKPGRFTMTLFANKSSSLDISDWCKPGGPYVEGFCHQDIQTARLQDYGLFYTNYAKKQNMIKQ
uniref:S-adenosylmethionine decarboxylase proenzyme n=1 Tax=Phallusia mammillata TaxID=59560 RepID=A0A6F9D722_9ASCI|nr:S-adenosylmethionine decarboxylase proenzyme [Phallusia mammillata]